MIETGKMKRNVIRIGGKSDRNEKDAEKSDKYEKKRVIEMEGMERRRERMIEIGEKGDRNWRQREKDDKNRREG